MRKILYLILLLFVSCSSIKQSPIIPYFLGLKAEKSIYNELLKSNKKTVFYVEHISDSLLRFNLVNLNSKESLFTNRKLFINDKFYPIVFDTDYYFYGEIKDAKPIVLDEDDMEVFMPTISEREKNIEAYAYSKKLLIFDDILYWIINKKGELIKGPTCFGGFSKPKQNPQPKKETQSPTAVE